MFFSGLSTGRGGFSGKFLIFFVKKTALQREKFTIFV